jgi:hypothetical protein
MTEQQIPAGRTPSPAGGSPCPDRGTVGSTPATILVEIDVVAVVPQP